MLAQGMVCWMNTKDDASKAYALTHSIKRSNDIKFTKFTKKEIIIGSNLRTSAMSKGLPKKV